MIAEKNLTLKAKSGVSKKGNTYYQLFVDLGYRQVALSWDLSEIAEIFGKSVAEMHDILNKEVGK